MKILWCTHSLAGFKAETRGYNGCGWITSLLDEFRKVKNVEIGIAFYFNKPTESIKHEGITFFPLQQGKIDVIGKIKTFFSNYTGWEEEEKQHLRQLKNVIEQFSPDVIHVWGTETDMGLIAKETNIPVIVHLQGLLHPYKNALCPPWISKWNYICKDGYNPMKIFKNINDLQYWKYKAEREIRIFKVCHHFFGRTHWDKALTTLFSPQSTYHYCSEMLRHEFYTTDTWNMPNDDKCRIISTISPPLYKGADLILKTALNLKKYGHIKFEWNIIGIKKIGYMERVTGIRAKEVNIKCLGVKTADEIKEIELKSHIYFHPSYIDNSPNSVCEAQILGMPVIAANVGGISTILENGNTGWLVPSNDPDMAASLIISLANNTDQLNAKHNITLKSSTTRHDKKSIINSLMQGYKTLLQ